MKGTFIVGLTTSGIKMLELYPRELLPEPIQDEIAKKSMPIGAREGDFITVVLSGYQAATMMMEVPSFEEADDRATLIGLGVILHEADNPMIYRDMLHQIITFCRKNKHYRYEDLMKIPKKLFDAFKRPRFQLKISDGKEITIELKGGVTEGQRIREALKRL